MLPRPGSGGLVTPLGCSYWGAIATYFLLSENRVNFFGALPFLLLLACPLMHIFMHHGDGGHGQHPGDRRPQAGPDKPDPPKQGDQS